MTERSAPRAGTHTWLVAAGMLAVCAAGVGLACGWRRGDPKATAPNPEPQPPAADATAPFAQWPRGVRPDAVVVLSGQTFGLLQPCGCSAKQLGGLERRANFLAGLRAKGWPVVGADLGDLVQPHGAIPEQSLMKYATAM